MTIILKKQDYDEILAHCLISLPNEACGLLGGRSDGEVKTVEKVYLLTNIDQSPEHFSLDTKEQFAVIKDIRSRNEVMLGNFHSHPNTPSRPSEEDKRLAFDSEVSYLILSLQAKGNPVLKSFRIKPAGVFEEELQII
ncbi:MAG: M67 family metallopeptidase [Desulfitobacteriaceae bacterium]